MRKENLDMSLGCDDALTAYGRMFCMAPARFACPQIPQQFKRLQCLNFRLLNSSLRGSLQLRRPHGRFVARTSRQDQRCKEFYMHNALRVAPVFH